MRTVDELVDTVEASWAPFRQALAALPADAFDRGTAAGWTVKEMLGHVAFWLETIEPVLVGMFRGQPVAEGWYGAGVLSITGEWPRADVHNAREAAWAAGRSPAEVPARLDAAYHRSLAVVRTLTGAELGEERFVRKVMDASARHFAMHLAELRGPS